jgi:hypothetical protein
MPSAECLSRLLAWGWRRGGSARDSESAPRGGSVGVRLPSDFRALGFDALGAPAFGRHTSRGLLILPSLLASNT